MKAQRPGLRQKRGSIIAEFPIALWILFFCFTYPFLDMCTILLRYTFFVAAVRDGVHDAAQSKTFLVNNSASDLSATNNAKAGVALTAGAFREIQVNSVTTSILATNITTLALTKYTAPLATPADPSTYLYELQSTVSGFIYPLITLRAGLLPPVPGLTAPIRVTVTGREFCEYPQGLNR
ncbi:MAG: hypothetical protein K2X81_06795 [Candidatus Obscuribacterales bacterium]|nr:hypothetical protein [Candidatus Obscuribacterales bacterium]